jgi:DNA primase
MPLLREDTRISFIFLKEGDDPDSFIKENGKEAFYNLAKDSKSLSNYFFETLKQQDDLSSIEGRSIAAKFAIPLIKSISNETIKQAYINEASNVCDIDFAKLIQGNESKKQINSPKKEKPMVDTKSIMKKSVLGIFMALIQHPKLANSKLFNLVNPDSKFSFMLEIRDIYIKHPNSAASIILEKIDQEKIKNVFGEALVSEIKISEEDALSMIEDCIALISQTYSEREEILKEKYNMNELTSSERRELQQIILKKDRMSQEEEALIKNLSSG